MSQKPKLLVDFCSYQAAKFAVEHWHYSQVLPKSKNVYLGVWECDKFIGSIIFGVGVNRSKAKPYNIKDFECAELVRVALETPKARVSHIVTRAIKRISKQSPGLRLIISYADPEQGHLGIIYQAMNWIYVGKSQPTKKVFYKGNWVHKRVVDLAFGNHKGFPTRRTLPKYKYIYPLDRAMRRQIAPLAQPYPKRADG